MNKKIYFNNKFISFITNESLITSYNKANFFPELSHQKLDELFAEFLNEDDSNSDKAFLAYYTPLHNFDMVFDYLVSNLHYIEAAGGLINKNDKFLFIYRLGRWDLPKGKLNKGEGIEHAAIRECEEECGIKNLSIVSPLSSTYHIYKYKKKSAFKQTFWFHMVTDYDKKLIPQTEENIEKVEWMSKEEIQDVVFKNSYFTIKDLVNEARSKGIIEG